MKHFLSLLVALALCLAASAQKGVVSGTISDQETGETLISAYIYVQNSDVIETTDFDGKYSVDLAPGTYDFRFTYIGFQDKIVTEIEVKKGEVTYLDVSMSLGSQELDEVVVTAKTLERTENALIMLQKRSDKIQDGISSQEMSRLAVGNVASAMTKVTGASVQEGKYVYIRGLGDRYSISQINGLPMPSIDPYRNSAQLDLIPTNLLDNIITSKTFTPDQPGTFTGGNINIKTKDFPEKETFSASVSFGFNPQNNFQKDFLTHEGGNADWLGYGSAARERPAFLSDSSFIKYSDRNAELSARFGDEEAANAIERGVHEMDLRFDTLHKTSLMDYGVSLSYGNSFSTGEKSSLGVIFSASHKNDHQHLENTIQSSWFVFDDKSGVLQNTGDYRKTESSENPVLNGFVGLAYKFNDFNSIDGKVMYNHNSTKNSVFIIGEDGNNIEAPSYKLGRALLFQEREMLNYQVSGQHIFQNLNNFEIEWRGSLVNAQRNEPNLRFFSSQYNSETDVHSIPLANVNDPFFFWRELNDDIKNGQVDFTIPFNLGSTGGNKFKFGGAVSTKDREFDEWRYIVAKAPSAQNFDGNIDTYFGEENTGIIDTTTLSNGNTRYITGNYINESTRIENSYFGNEDVYAFYGMVTIAPFKKFKVVAGARYEETDIFVQSRIVEAIEGEEPDSTNTGSIESGDLLPSVNLIYALTDEMNLRASYNKTLARPNLREIAPFASFDPLIDQFFIGNPNLTTTDITNLDLRWEWFLNPGEIFAISAFYKSFDNPISLQYLNSSNPEFQYTNVDNGEIMGLEFELRKNLTFISPTLENFKLATNFAIIDSKTDVILQSGLEPEERPFEGQAPFIGNASINYNNFESNWDITLAYNYLGDRLSVIGRESPDIYERARSTIDFIASKTMGHVSLKFTAKNLLDPDYVTSSDYEGLEYITRKYRRGREFGISIEYKL